MKRAVFLDIDGTIINEKMEGPFAGDVEAIETARRHGHMFILCTGRGFAHIPRKIRGVSWIDGIVSGGGAHVITGGKTLYQKTVDIGILCVVSALFLSAGKKCTFQGDTAIFGINKGWESGPDWGEDEPRIPVTGPDDFAEKYPLANIAMMTVEKNTGAEIKTFLERSFTIHPQIPHLDVFIKGENKAKGMAVVLEALGVRREDSVGIGDSANDLDMIRYAGAGIAVGNAGDDLKAAADWVSAPCGQGGVARALEYLGMI